MAGSRKQQAPLGCSVKCKGVQAPLHGSWWGSPLKPRNVVITGTQGGIFPTAASMLGRVEKPASFIAKPHLKCLQRLRLLHPILGLPPHLHIPLAGAVQCPAPILHGKPLKELLPTAVQCQQQNAALLLISGSVVPKCSRHQDTAEGSPCSVLPAGTRNPPPSPTAL